MTTPEAPRSHGPAGGRADWLWAATLVAVLYGLLAGAFVPHFDTMDDVVMAMWSSGLCMALEPQSHIIFSHEIIGWTLKHLYLTWPAVGWYGWMHFTVLFVSNSVICRTLLRVGGWMGLLGFLSFFGLTQIDAFVNMQFTKTAFYATLAGAALLALANTGSKTDRGLCAGACLLAMLGSLVRAESFVFALAAFLPPLVLIWWQQDNSAATAWRRRGTGVALFVGLPLLVAATASVTDRLGDWARYYNYRIERAQVIDFGERIVYSEKTRPVFDRIHWTENHLGMLREASYFDPQVFSTENYRQVLAAFPKQWRPAESWVQLREFGRSFQDAPYSQILIAGGLILIVGFSRRTVWTMIASCACGAGLIVTILLLFKAPPPASLCPFSALLILFSPGSPCRPCPRPAAFAAMSWLQPLSEASDS